MSHYVYRLYCVEQLLYVGSSSNPDMRIKCHRNEKAWPELITHSDAEEFETRAEALEAERLAIVAERPKYNVTHGAAVQALLKPKAKVYIPVRYDDQTAERIAELAAAETGENVSKMVRRLVNEALDARAALGR